MRAMVPSTVVAMAAAAAAWSAPAVASAQVPVARVVLYEVSESLKLSSGTPTRAAVNAHGREGTNDDDYQRAAATLGRLANAALLGDTIAAYDSSTIFSGAQYMTSTAVSNVSLDPRDPAFGTGPISGTFDVAVYRNLTGQKSLSNLVVIGSGRLRGVLDLRAPLNPDPTQRQPLAPVSGQWTTAGATKRSRNGGNFSGVFLIPFQLPPTAVAQIKAWTGLDLTGVSLYPNPPQLGSGICRAGDARVWDLGPPIGAVCPVVPDERVLDFPLTKAVIFLFN